MFHIKSEEVMEMTQEDHIGSPSVDDGSLPGSPFANSPPLKKGPWTSVEDAILMDYVKKHGEGNWNAVQKNTGLSRCGKSCRLRWANHLRPNLKKGAFTAEEEKIIIELHARMGNKWARMASHLPGRTDNEIKNYWNTRIKRCQRANLPIYPSNICRQGTDEEYNDTSEFSCGEKLKNEMFPGAGIYCPDYASDNFLSYSNQLPSVSVSGLLGPDFGSGNTAFAAAMNGTKALKETGGFSYGLNGATPFGYSSVEQCSDIKFRNIGFNYLYDTDPGGGPITGSHALISGNFSASRPAKEPVKLELPSLQDRETELDNWLHYPVASNVATPDVVDAHVSSSATPSVQSESISPRNSGLLEALLHEAQTLGSAKSPALPRSSSSSFCTPLSPGLDICKEYWEEQSRPTSPLSSCSPFPVQEHATPHSGNSLQTGTIGSIYQLLPTELSSGLSSTFFSGNQDESPGDSMPCLESSQLDELHGSSWFPSTKKSLYKDVIGMLLGED